MKSQKPSKGKWDTSAGTYLPTLAWLFRAHFPVPLVHTFLFLLCPLAWLSCAAGSSGLTTAGTGFETTGLVGPLAHGRQWWPAAGRGDSRDGAAAPCRRQRPLPPRRCFQLDCHRGLVAVSLRCAWQSNRLLLTGDASTAWPHVLLTRLTASRPFGGWRWSEEMLLALDHKISKLALRLEKACAGNRLSGWPAGSTWTDVMQHLEVWPAGPAPVEHGTALPRPLPCCAFSCLPACPLRVILSCAYRSLHLTSLSFCQFRGLLWRATRSLPRPSAPAATHDAHCNSAACLARTPSPVPAACVRACLDASCCIYVRADCVTGHQGAQGRGMARGFAGRTGSGKPC